MTQTKFSESRLVAQGVSVGYGDAVIIEDLSLEIVHQGFTALVGPNGSGKSTLLEAIAVASGFNPEGGTKNFGFSTRLTRLVFLVQWKVSLISPSFCLIQGADVAKRSQFPERIPPVFCR